MAGGLASDDFDLGREDVGGKLAGLVGGDRDVVRFAIGGVVAGDDLRQELGAA